MLDSETTGLAQARLRHHLEVQSLIVERTIREYCQRPFRVTGGDVRGNRIWYEMPGEAAWEPPVLPKRMIEQALRQRLGTPAQLLSGQSGLRVAVERPSPPVDLLTLMQRYQVPAAGAVTAVLGLDDGGRPLQLDLARAGHILLAGDAASGKTALLKTIAASLAQSNRPGQLQLLVIQNPNDAGLLPLNGLCGDLLLRPVVTTAAEAARALAILAARLSSLPAAAAASAKGPRLVTLIDQVETLLDAAGFAALDPLVRLLGTNPEAGMPVSLVVSTQQPQNDLVRYCRARWGARIVGQVADAAQAAAAAGRPCSRAERLSGDGAFLLVRRGERRAHYFQAAYADRYDLSFLARRQGCGGLVNGRCADDCGNQVNQTGE